MPINRDEYGGLKESKGPLRISAHNLLITTIVLAWMAIFK